MKTTLKVIFAIGALGLLINSSAHADQTCSQVDFSGKFRSASSSDKVYSVTQNGCIVKIRDHKNLWTFDLSGQTKTRIAPYMLEQNRHSAAGTRLAQSTVFKMELQENSIAAEVALNGPKDNENAFDVDVVAKGYLALKLTPIDATGKSRVDGVSVEWVDAKLVDVRDNAFTGQLANAFLTGANYILKKLNLASLVGPTVDIERAN
jgi:hypothetical protein